MPTDMHSSKTLLQTQRRQTNVPGRDELGTTVRSSVQGAVADACVECLVGFFVVATNAETLCMPRPVDWQVSGVAEVP